MAQITTNFIDELATYLASIASLSLTKGSNLFEEQIHETDTVGDHIALFDDGYNTQVARRRRLAWQVRIVSIRDTRSGAIESLRPIVDHLVNEKVFPLTNYQIINATESASPTFVQDLENGRAVAQTVIVVDVIPGG